MHNYFKRLRKRIIFSNWLKQKEYTYFNINFLKIMNGTTIQGVY